jgi:hypothetical protein
MANEEHKIKNSFWCGCVARYDDHQATVSRSTGENDDLIEHIFDIDFDPNSIKKYKDFNKKIEVFNNNFTIPTSISADIKKYYKSSNVITAAEIK